MPRSAPKTVLTTALQVCQFPDITRQTLSALKAQIRLEQGRARELWTKAVEKEEDSERTQGEAMRLDSQADKLADTLDKMERQRVRLDRKIAVLEGNKVRHSIRLSEAKQAILMADYYGYEYDQHQLIVLMDHVEAKTRKADLNRVRAYDLALSGIDNRIHGNRIRATQELRKMERWIDEATILDIEIARHSNQLMRLNKRIEVAESQGRRAQAIKKDLE